MPTNPPRRLRWTARGFGGQWFSNKAALFKMVTNIKTWYRLEAESSNSDFSTSGENDPIRTGECTCKMKIKDQ